MGAKVQEEVLAVLNGGIMPMGWNETTIVLIPKVKNPESLTQYRPTSLCNVLYKLISKVFANRMKGILPDLISPTQSAFVPGRMIADNVLLAYEITHLMHKKKGGRQGLVEVKLDMSKAYDRVEWRLLERMMLTMGFAATWVSLVEMCVLNLIQGQGERKLNGFLSSRERPTSRRSLIFVSLHHMCRSFFQIAAACST